MLTLSKNIFVLKSTSKESLLFTTTALPPKPWISSWKEKLLEQAKIGKWLISLIPLASCQNSAGFEADVYTSTCLWTGFSSRCCSLHMQTVVLLVCSGLTGKWDCILSTKLSQKQKFSSGIVWEEAPPGLAVWTCSPVLCCTGKWTGSKRFRGPLWNPSWPSALL